MFNLHPQLASDCITLSDGPVCRILLMNDSRYPWLIFVPRREGVRELHELSAEDLAVTMDEVMRGSRLLENLVGVEKINIAAIGNMVPQLHIHVVARNSKDQAWPKPIWGVGQAVPYEPDKLDALREKFQKGLVDS